MSDDPSSKPVVDSPVIDSTVAFNWLGTAVVVVTLLLAVVRILPAIQQAREAARRSQSRNNLKQLGLAMHNYHDSFKTFPPGGIFNSSGDAFHGWAANLLPYIDASPIYNWINFSVSWNDSRNAGLFRRTNPVFVNPSLERPADGPHFAKADYSANSHLFAPNSFVGFSKIGYGRSAFLLGELGGDFTPWGCPFNWRPLGGLNDDPRTYGRPEGFGGYFLMVDGSVQWFSPDTSADVLEALRGPDLASAAYEGPRIVRPASFPYPPDAQERSFMDLSGAGRFGALLIKNSRGDVIEVSLYRSKGDTRRANDSDLDALTKFHELRELRADGDFTDAGMAALHQLHRLEVLQLSSCDVSDAALEFLKRLPALRHLTLERRELTQSFLKTISEMSRLEELHLKIRDPGEDLAEFEADLQQRIGLKVRIE